MKKELKNEINAGKRSLNRDVLILQRLSQHPNPK